MTSITERLRAQKAARETATTSNEKRPIAQQIKPADISLRGTGLTKREAEKNTRAYEREAKASLKADKDLFVSAADADFQRGIADTIASMRDGQKTSDFVYDDSQLAAIAGILHNKYAVLIGAAGTGKTTVTKKIVEELG